jgi:hypothetical protein
MAKCYACPHAIDPDGYHGHCDLADRDMKLTDPTPEWCPLRGRALIDDVECFDAPEAKALAVGAARLLIGVL